MGVHAERVADKHEVTREAQDEFALRSHQRALAAIAQGRFADEIVPVEVPSRKGPITVDTDENPRPDTSLEALARLKPAFKPDGGTVTAGNAPGITDGAAAVVLASEEAVSRDQLTPIARITGYTQADVAPEWLFEAPIEGVRRLLARLELNLDAFDLIEINEAFAAQVLADGNALGFDWDRVNVNGGAIALGHPIGASLVSSPRCSTSCAAAVGDEDWRRCAWAGVGRSPWRSRRSEAAGPPSRHAPYNRAARSGLLPPSHVAAAPSACIGG